MATLPRQPEGSAKDDQINVVSTDGDKIFNSKIKVSSLQTAAPDVQFIQDHINGVTTAPGIDAQHYVNIFPGTCADSANAVYMTLVATITKRIDIATGWVAGSIQAGLADAVTLGADQWLHIFIIQHTNGTVDAGFDTSITAANLLTDSSYTYYRRIGSILTDGSSDITSYDQVGNQFYWRDEVNDVNVASANSENTVTLTVPTGLQVQADVIAEMNYSTTAAGLRIYTTGQSNSPVDNTNRVVRATGSATFNSARFLIHTDTSAQINWRASSTGSNVDIRTSGWVDPRTS